MMKFSLPKEVLEIINRIEGAGFEAWCVGGCVRDMLRDTYPDDFDITSNAPSGKIAELFDRVIPTGIKHGTVTVLMNGVPFEITRYRIDGEYSDNRRPDSVEFTESIENDLSRRDFTINAISYHPERGLFDPFSGEDDIKKGIIRTVGDPDKRFSEDALRIFRAIRFSAKLGFKIEVDTLTSIKKNAENLNSVSAERIAVELLKTLSSENPQMLEVIIKSGGLKRFGFEGCQSLEILKNVPSDTMLRFSCLCLSTKTEALSTAEKFRLSNLQKKSVAEFSLLLNEKDLTLPFIKANCKSIGLEGALLGVKAYSILKNKDDEIFQKVKKAIEKKEPYLLEHLSISGEQIKGLGFKGEDIGKVHQILLSKVRQNPELNTEKALKDIAQNLN